MWDEPLGVVSIWSLKCTCPVHVQIGSAIGWLDVHTQHDDDRVIFVLLYVCFGNGCYAATHAHTYNTRLHCRLVRGDVRVFPGGWLFTAV